MFVFVVKIKFCYRHKDKDESTYYRDVLAYVCGVSAFLGAITVMSLIARLRSIGGYVVCTTFHGVFTPVTLFFRKQVYRSKLQQY